jgi:hypothetical protein
VGIFSRTGSSTFVGIFSRIFVKKNSRSEGRRNPRRCRTVCFWEMTDATTATMNTDDDDDDDEQQEDPPASLRIACLIPSATDICRMLGLTRHLVGVTHECEIRPEEVWEEGAGSGRLAIRILTEDKLPGTLSQGEIHEIVQENSSLHAAAAATTACPRGTQGNEKEMTTMPPSL